MQKKTPCQSDFPKHVLQIALPAADLPLWVSPTHHPTGLANWWFFQPGVLLQIGAPWLRLHSVPPNHNLVELPPALKKKRYQQSTDMDEKMGCSLQTLIFNSCFLSFHRYPARQHIFRFSDTSMASSQRDTSPSRTSPEVRNPSGPKIP